MKIYIFIHCLTLGISPASWVRSHPQTAKVDTSNFAHCNVLIFIRTQFFGTPVEAKQERRFNQIPFKKVLKNLLLYISKSMIQVQHDK